MKRKKQKDISLGFAGLGLVLGFFLGSGIVYWYFNRQDDSIAQPAVYASRPSVAEKPRQQATPQASPSRDEAPADTVLSFSDTPQQPAPHLVIEDIRVMQDSLLLVRSFSLGQFQPHEQYALLESLLGNNPEESQPEIHVEFWISPLQYTGYKKIKNRIVVFGLEHPHQAHLHVSSASLIMEYMNQTFLLQDHKTFQPLTPYNDQELLDNSFEHDTDLL